MDQSQTSVPFDPDFDSDMDQGSASSVDSVHPLMAFYAGIACSVLVFGVAGILFIISLIY